MPSRGKSVDRTYAATRGKQELGRLVSRHSKVTVRRAIVVRREQVRCLPWTRERGEPSLVEPTDHRAGQRVRKESYGGFGSRQRARRVEEGVAAEDFIGTKTREREP